MKEEDEYKNPNTGQVFSMTDYKACKMGLVRMDEPLASPLSRLASEYEDLGKRCVPFMPKGQLLACAEMLCGEEGDYFKEVLERLADTWEKMPFTQDLHQNTSIMCHDSHLRYFNTNGNQTWHLFGKPGKGEPRAFGAVDVGYGFEMGDFAFNEEINPGEEEAMLLQPETGRFMLNIDFDFLPTPWDEVKR